ncbi:PqqD family protein [Salinibacter ruber]|uniref:PqqD family peptide modification chaperone n=1 Tax=Salinibacter ruber TaxID=146919 RepID=A0A9X2Q6M3_9BACT|nr:PqqD family protein [Salinibacter ruber]MCS3665203.1 hypothetical protein [Salinibacter ruber]MCS3678745.1 hypothetical protein [Salinibacter ruber]MCS3682310.1 hypothetical protein [Salinibacter ruber]MCS3756066.1 hypothetical protein [Salinibacter ruber]
MSKTPHVLVFPPLTELQVPSALYGRSTERWKILAHVVAAHVRQVSMDQRASVVLRPGEAPRLSIIGWFSQEEAAHIRAAIPWFINALSRLRLVDYTQVEAGCIRLGEALKSRLQDQFLEDASFVGIPRGGTVVLGLLSYVLGLDQTQIHPQDLTCGPLIVVDDCFLSGARLARFLEEHPSPTEVVAAGLYAHPDLRTAVEQVQPRVKACVTARDLTDYAPEIYGDDYEAWKARWDRRETGPRLWTGITEHLYFPWGEPDYGIWNSETEQTDRAWTVAPPDRSLEARFSGQRGSEGAVQIQRPASGAISVPPEVFYATFSDHVLIGATGSEECLELDGSAADFWMALVTCETISEAKVVLQRKYEIEPERLKSDLRAFVETLADRQFLETEGSVDAISF